MDTVNFGDSLGGGAKGKKAKKGGKGKSPTKHAVKKSPAKAKRALPASLVEWGRLCREIAGKAVVTKADAAYSKVKALHNAWKLKHGGK